MDHKIDKIVISSPHFQESVCDTSLKVGDAVISSSVRCHNLGVIFDSKSDMKLLMKVPSFLYVINFSALLKSALFSHPIILLARMSP